ncbi:MAG TPA: hypothetical protein DCM73_09065 [Clostridiales bacterium]|nr:hypothetical protein [Clostridiales bacterium]
MAKEVKKQQEPKWITVEKFRAYYDFSKSYAYELVNAKGFPAKKYGKRKGMRVDMNRTDEYFDKIFN